MSTLTIGGGKGNRAGMTFDLDGALETSRNFALLVRFLPQSAARALSTMRRRIGPEARRDIQRQYRISAGRVNQGLRVSQSASGLRITGAFRGIGLRNFSARQTRRGVTASIFLGGKRSLRDSAFFAPLLGGGEANRHVVRREGEKRVMKSGRYAGQRRQPIVVEYGPTVAQMLGKEGRPQRLAEFAVGVLGSEAARLIESALRENQAPSVEIFDGGALIR